MSARVPNLHKRFCKASRSAVMFEKVDAELKVVPAALFADFWTGFAPPMSLRGDLLKESPQVLGLAQHTTPLKNTLTFMDTQDRRQREHADNNKPPTPTRLVTTPCDHKGRPVSSLKRPILGSGRSEPRCARVDDAHRATSPFQRRGRSPLLSGYTVAIALWVTSARARARTSLLSTPPRVAEPVAPGQQ